MSVRGVSVLLVVALIASGWGSVLAGDGIAESGAPSDDYFGGCEPLTAVERTHDGVSAELNETAARSVSAGQYPPGVGPEGIVNASRLERAHVQNIRRSGFVAEFNSSSTYEERPAPKNGTSGKRYAATANLTRFEQVYHDAGGNVTAWKWANATTFFYRGHSNLVPGRPIRYSATPVESLRLTIPERIRWDLDSVATDLRNGDFNVTRIFEADGQTLFVLRSHRISYALGQEDDWNKWTYNGTVVVDESGRIHYFHSYRHASARDDHRTVRRTYRLCKLGVDSVPRPSWIEDVPPEAYLNVSVQPEDVDQRYLVISNDRPDPLPANTVVFVKVRDTLYRVAFQTPLQPGETRYAYFTGDGFHLTDRKSVAVREGECFGPWYETEAYSETGAFFGGRGGTTDDCEYATNVTTTEDD